MSAMNTCFTAFPLERQPIFGFRDVTHLDSRVQPTLVSRSLFGYVKECGGTILSLCSLGSKKNFNFTSLCRKAFDYHSKDEIYTLFMYSGAVHPITVPY